MKKITLILTLLIITTVLLKLNAQNPEIDSLENLLNEHKKKDTTRINLLNNIAYKLYSVNIDKTLIYAEEAIELANKLNFAIGKSNSLRLIGIYYSIKSNFPKALEYYQKSLKICSKTGDKKGVSGCLNNIGLIYNSQGNYSQALEYFQKALKKFEELENKQGVSRCLNNIGLIYNSQGNYSQSLEYYQKALEIFEELRDKSGISTCLNNIGNIHLYKGNYPLALEYFQNSLKRKIEIGDKSGICLSYRDIGAVYLKTNNYTKALDYTLKSLKIANEHEFLNFQTNIHVQLSDIYANTKNFKKAYESYVLFKELNDSIFNEENIKKITGLEYQYEYEKEKQAIELEQQKRDAVLAEEAKQQKIVRNSFIAGFILMTMLVLYVLRSFLQKRKANRILSEQKNEIEEQNTELLYKNEEIQEINKEINKQKQKVFDSINYAKKIQSAMLTSEEQFKNLFSEYFIFYKPKDIVSGDFYWLTEIRNYIIIASVDCTGHGIPGAFMSMLGIAFLNEMVRKKEITQANQVLEELRTQVKSSLHQTGQKDESQDGMDMSLCVIDTVTNKMQYACANNPINIIRKDNKANIPELIELYSDPMPIGIYFEEYPFKNYEIQLKPNDYIYLFTDGYTDQFGGIKNDKFMNARFNELLLSIYDQPMIEQKTIIEETYNTWKGHYSQVDDVLVMGIRI